MSSRSVPDRSVALNHQIYLELRGEIADGLWVGRTDFPSEEDVAKRFQVSVITSRSALTRLGEEGWIERGRGRRTQVIRGPEKGRQSAPTIFPVGPHRPYSYKVLSHGLEIPSAQACEAFSVAPGSKLWTCHRVRVHQNRPHSVTMNVQKPELGARHLIGDLKKLPMVQLLAKANISVATMTRRVSAGLTPWSVAHELGIPPQHPTLIYTFTLKTAEGEAIEWVRIHVHPDETTPVEVLNVRDGTWSSSEPP